MSKHIVESFETELERMDKAIGRMGALALRQVDDALRSLLNGDDRLAARTVEEDREIDALDAQVMEQAVTALALRQPMAADLREVLAALKIPDELERIGDLGKGIARRTYVMKNETPRPPLVRLRAMGDLVKRQLAAVMDAYEQRDANAAERIWKRDREIDDWHSSVYRELLTYMMEDPRTITACAHLMFIAKNLERMGDHCTHIAETVYYVAKGERLKNRPKGDDPARPAGIGDDAS
jgi:phosphate transport system protein